jgi:RNA polymerase sigma-70 factor (ECF subfamily)
MADNHQPESDAALLARMHGGEAEAAQLIVERHLGRLVGMAGRLLGDPADAEDVAQEAFLRLWRQAGRWRAEAPLGHWLVKVAYNLSMDRLRRRRGIALESVPEPADPAPSPARAAHAGEMAAAVAAALAELPERQRAAIHLAHLEGFTNPETAAALGCSVEAVESLLARARRALRGNLAQWHHDLEGEI